MINKFWVGDYSIDLSRNQIQLGRHIETLQPKVLAVLLVLARRSGQVVSHETLLTEVWDNYTVTANTLQRCITQLRKALGDNSKAQAVIKTHSKQGYSLELEVRWEEEQGNRPTANESVAVQTSGVNWKGGAALLGICVLLTGAFLVSGFLQKENTPQKYTRMQPITASDAKEFHPNYSPDGRYLVFHRYLGTCQNHIWAKELSTQREFQLTQTPGIYGAHSWSADGNQLAFILQESCALQVEPQLACWRLQTLDFAAALQSPQVAKIRLDCDTEYTESPFWMNDGRIVMIKSLLRQDRLVVFDARNNQLEDFYVNENARIDSLSYSPAKDRIGVILGLPDRNNFLMVMDSQGQQISFEKINDTSIIGAYHRHSISFHPSGDFLISEVYGKFFRLSLNGQLTPIDLPQHDHLFDPNFHPDGQQIVASHGNVDLDITQITMHSQVQSTTSVGFNQVYQPYPSLARTTTSERDGRFQPNGTAIAFVSERSGNEQLWLLNNQQLRQLTHFSTGTKIEGFDWSPDGKQLAYVANDQINLLDLAGKSRELSTELPIKSIQQWSSANQLLVIAEQTLPDQVFTYDIAEQSLNDTGLAQLRWVRMNAADEFFYIDYARNFWHKSADETRLVSELYGLLHGKSFVLQGNKLNGINSQDWLWQYDLQENDLVMRKQLDPQAWWLSDIQDENLLITQGIAARKEIVVLSQ